MLPDSFLSKIILVILMYITSSTDIKNIPPRGTSIVEVLFKRLKSAKVNLALFNFRFRALV